VADKRRLKGVLLLKGNTTFFAAARLLT